MQRSIRTSEHCIFVDPPNIVNVTAATATVLLPNEQYVNSGEISSRFIQNVGGNRLYYSIGLTNGATPPGPQCDGAVNFHGYLESGMQLDCGTTRQIVCGYSTAGTIVATLILRRKD